MTFQIWIIAFLLLLLAIASAVLCWEMLHDYGGDAGWRFATGFAAGIVACVLGVGSIILPISTITSEIGCRNSANNLQLPYRYSLSAGCYVKFHGQWIGINRALGIIAG